MDFATRAPVLFIGQPPWTEFDCSQEPLPDKIRLLLWIIEGAERRHRLAMRWSGRPDPALMANDERLRFDLAFALKKVTITGFHRAFTEDDRTAIAKVLVEHLKRCRWEFSKSPADGISGG